jgi:uncharacterized protein
VNQKKLSETLDEVVSSVVNNVGVNLNTASVSLLRYVSGINSSLARKIVQYRDEKGRIASRGELTSVPGMGPKSYEQCAGFLKIPESADPLDNTWVHPENYAVAREVRETMTLTGGLSPAAAAVLKEKHGVGDATLRDIEEELRKPNRDPREGYPRPIMRKGIMSFDDLSEGMMITGKIKNVVDFGAFVDLGIKETALVHISEMGDRFIKDPLEAVKVGDVLEFRIINLDRDRRRIGLSRKTQGTAPANSAAAQNGAQTHGEQTHSAQTRSEQARGEQTRSEQAHSEQTRSAAADGVADGRPQGAARPHEGGVSHGGGGRHEDGGASHEGGGRHEANRGSEKKKVFTAEKTGGDSGGHGRPGGGPDSGHRGGGAADGGNAGFNRRQPGTPAPRPQDDDGTMYNPFAEAFKNMGKKK